ncbi:MAG: DUF6043 family protein [Mangrovibacterium sp.]
MPQQDFDNFKSRLKDWKETHPDDYNLFEEEMNSQDAVGYQKILSLAVVGSVCPLKYPEVVDVLS